MGSGIVRIDLLHFLAGYHTRQLNQALSVKGKASSLDIAPLTVLNSGTLQPRKWQLTGNDCGTAAHAVAAQSLR